MPINYTLRHTLQGLTRRLDIPHVFYDNATGNPYGDVKRSFNTALRRSGIRDFHFHDLRHTFESHLIMAGVDVTTPAFSEAYPLLAYFYQKKCACELVILGVSNYNYKGGCAV